MLTILSIILALILGFAAAACILAPELADHEACKPAPQGGESWKAGNGENRKSGTETRRHIDVAA